MHSISAISCIISEIMYRLIRLGSVNIMIIMSTNRSETKRERFVRLAEKRTNEVLDRLRILGGCSNKRMYEYSKKDVEGIFRAIDTEVKRVKGMFADEKKNAFRLGE